MTLTARGRRRYIDGAVFACHRSSRYSFATGVWVRPWGGTMRRLFLVLSLAAVAAGGGGAATLASAANGGVAGRLSASLKASDTAPAPGERVVFRGRVTPSAAGARVRFQERDRTGWRTVATPRL